MDERRKRRLRVHSRPNFKGIAAVVAVAAAVIVLIAILFPAAVHDSSRGQFTLDMTKTAVIIRDETAYYAEFDFNNIAIRADEGKTVAAGEDLGLVYKLGYTEDIARRLYEVQEKIYALQTSLMSGISNTEISDAEEKVAFYRDALAHVQDGGSELSVLEIEHSLREAVKARNNLLRDVVQPTEELTALYSEESLQARRLDEWTSGRIVSQEDGIFSCYSDGYETSLCMDKLDRISSEQISNAVSGKKYTTDNFMYRIVKPGHFCIGIITERNSVPRIYSGEEYSVTFNGIRKTYTGKCVRSCVSGDYYLSLIRIDDEIGELLTRRTAKVNVTANFSGNKVLTKAIHYGKEDGQTYVYFKTGDGTEKIAVDALATDGKYAIIRAADSQKNIDGLKYSTRKD